ncbi:alpha-ketoglutarate-dependent dioxygenase alkB homolog 3 isoform X1 [Petromyzon marinus]|uniref:alpha-ketoglutarate-dependent dioxygenase alkB homolog 3 isoform X1 n=1 Tax=Petromyzon marinus TaxID=7757 RepID=UPI003F71D220
MDKRSRPRVQGGWATPATNNKSRPPAASQQVTKAPISAPKQNNAETQDGKFVYVDPEKPLRRAPDVKVINVAGDYEISTGPTGVSSLRLFPGFVERAEADWMFEQLAAEIPWGQRTYTKHGVTSLEPRLTCWYGDHPYTYSRLTMEANPHWHPLVTMLRDRIAEVTGVQCNSVLANWYRNEHDSVDWHCDDEPDLGPQPSIASLSLGEMRSFELRKKPPPEDEGDFTYVERLRVPLGHGDLILMFGALQDDWQHRVPKEYHSRAGRINLTYRTIYPNKTAHT